jgi:hypothetical protein
MPDVLKPEQKFTVKVGEKTGKELTYTIAVVDEGLLDLTRFKTPNAWDSFYVREALGVKTWDIYDDVIGAYGGKINQIFSIGGDQDLGGGKAKKANRFKPVVLYYGPFKLEKGQNIPKEAIDKYFVANTAEIFVPDKVVNVDAKGKIKLVDTLTKTKSIKKIKGKPVIKLEDKNINGIVINQEGEKLMDRSKMLLDLTIQQKRKKESKSKRRNYQKEYMKKYRSKDV